MAPGDRANFSSAIRAALLEQRAKGRTRSCRPWAGFSSFWQFSPLPIYAWGILLGLIESITHCAFLLVDKWGSQLHSNPRWSHSGQGTRAETLAWCVLMENCLLGRLAEFNLRLFFWISLKMSPCFSFFHFCSIVISKKQFENGPLHFGLTSRTLKVVKLT